MPSRSLTARAWRRRRDRRPPTAARPRSGASRALRGGRRLLLLVPPRLVARVLAGQRAVGGHHRFVIARLGGDVANLPQERGAPRMLGELGFELGADGRAFEPV